MCVYRLVRNECPLFFDLDQVYGVNTSCGFTLCFHIKKKRVNHYNYFDFLKHGCGLAMVQNVVFAVVR